MCHINSVIKLLFRYHKNKHIYSYLLNITLSEQPFVWKSDYTGHSGFHTVDSVVLWRR